MADIFLVRHGQASYGAENYDALSPVGREQSMMLGAHLASMKVRPELSICGGMRRHEQTLAEMCRFFKPGEIIERGAFREVDMWGILDAAAKTVPSFPDPKRIGAALRIGLTEWMEGRIECDETWREYCARVARGVEDAVASGAGTIAIITSGGAIAAAAASALGASPQAQISIFLRLYNSSVTRLSKTRSGMEIHSLNNIAHLENPACQHLVTYI